MNNVKINKNRLLKNFFNFVEIDSESGNEETFREYLQTYAREMGYSNTRVDNYGNLYIRIEGKGEKIMVNTHLDTVKNGVGITPQIRMINGEEYVTSAGDTILGADPKASIAAIFEVLNILKERGFKNRNIELTFTCNEESGIPTADKLKSDAKFCIVPDRGTPLGEIILEGPDAKVFSVEVKGKTAYATTSYDDGIDALKSAIETISQIKTGNFSNNTIVNIGKINGGEMPSMVCENVEFWGSCYTFEIDESDKFFEQLEEAMRETDRKYGTKSELTIHEYFPGFRLDKNSAVYEIADKAIREAGLKPKIKKYMAVSNANLINSIGIPTVLISYGAIDQHTTAERISVDDLVKLTEILLNVFTS